ncbi:cell division ATP-binding protein FtsE [Clostridium sp.]|uniref:cell division ATP-binding protein FtsE n=1 Tax=Clostridium sp. TaxID=1506 RepID=UPI0032174FB9
MIEFKNVSKVYNESIVAISNINLRIEKGEFVFLVGVSGSGKSTFMKSLLKEVDPSSGRIIVNNVDVTELSRAKIPYYRRKFGVVFQDFRLIQTLNVYENVAFAMRVTECTQKEIRKKVPVVLAMVGLTKKYNAFPNELSGGEQQRVAIARAIVNSPAVLIADEPTGNLDPETALEIMELLQDINDSGTTVIMATHAKEIVDSMGKRVVAIEKGSIVRDEQRGRYNNEDECN